MSKRVPGRLVNGQIRLDDDLTIKPDELLSMEIDVLAGTLVAYTVPRDPRGLLVKLKTQRKISFEDE